MQALPCEPFAASPTAWLLRGSLLVATAVLLASAPAEAVTYKCPSTGDTNYFCCDGSQLWRCVDDVGYDFGDCASQGKFCNYVPSRGSVNCSSEAPGAYSSFQYKTCDVTECTPNCTGRTCGNDGCGGSCGTCAAGLSCNSAGACEVVPLTCDDIYSVTDGAPTCCAGNVAFSCYHGTPIFNDCANPPRSSDPGSPNNPQFCNVADRSNPNFPAMGCTNDGASYPSEYIACPPLRCTGSCTGRQCGSDGCVGSCGTCPAGQACTADGKCEGTVLTAASIGKKFCCSGTKLWFYADNYEPQSFDCSTTAGFCNWNPGLKQMTCSSTAPGSFQEFVACPGAACTKKCDGRTCGPDGCGGTCGSCLSGQACNPSGQCEGVCTPFCPYGTQCGDDGCGGTCGTCASGLTCEDGSCIGNANSCRGMTGGESCCDGKHLFFCGNDTRLEDFDCAKVGGTCAGKGGGQMGCSFSAGFASERTTCEWACQPQCDGKTCGPDGCGGVCGECFPGQTCNAQGKCGTCQRNCINKRCGDDGCGGSCGSCGDGLSCDPTSRLCVMPEGSCGSMSTGSTCCSGTHMRECLSSGRLSDIDCAPGATCGAKGTLMGCTTNAAIDQNYRFCADACTPDCEGKTCGSDGCNGSCGTCTGDEFCNAAQKCQCRPNCNGVECGDDGCGGSCGACSAGSTCSNGQCLCVSQCDGHCGGDDGCGGTCPGCPTGQVCGADRYCHYACRPDCAGNECGDDGCGGSCGTCGVNDLCDRGSCEPKPPPEQVCTPDCTGRTCGDDGCGGTCGTCPYGTCNFFGKCSCYPSCDGKKCNAQGTDCFYAEKNCGDDGCGGSCGTCAAGQACKPNGFCGCAQQCQGKQCGDDGCGGSCGPCPRGYQCASGQCTCTPNCANGRCGPDGCGGTCGTTCGAGEYCQVDLDGGSRCACKPQCDGKTCGPNGCGGLCGVCPGGTQCDDESGQCECAPKCSGPYKNCGPDGCGGVCGTCKSNQACDSRGLCQCVPNCIGKSCGPDGCGGTCGRCQSSNPRVECNPSNGQCECQPYCADRACGDDFCGGSCGSCPDDKMCAQGGLTSSSTRCVCKPKCDGKACGPDGCGGVCGVCPGASVCTGGQCICTPKCNGRECGSDGCGGVCGACASDQTCDPGGSGQCLDCTADCDGRTCGSDGCGGTCGACPSGRSCGADGNCYDNRCPNTPDVGCCWGDTIKKCSRDYGPYTYNCRLRGESCGWDEAAGKYDCIAQSNPRPASGSPVRECPGTGVCTPNCTGYDCSGNRCTTFTRDCGSDGCGGTCGSCASGKACDTFAGRCKVDPCDGLGAGGCCEQEDGELTTSLFSCVPGTTKWSNLECTSQRGADGQPKKCGWSKSDQKVKCVDSSTPDDPAHPAMCPPAKCIPHCGAGDQCGSDGCGGTCGSCATGWSCEAKPDHGGVCKPPCQRNCAGKQCGPDGCGGFCSLTTYTTNNGCPPGTTCNESAFTCDVVDVCEGIPLGTTCCDNQTVMSCKGGPKHLESNACANGDYCGWDAGLGRYACGHNNGKAAPAGSPARQCPRAGPCIPSCSGKSCGSDGCGGSCGNCTGVGETCNDFGQCEAPCEGGIPTGGCCVDNADGTQARKWCVKGGGAASDVAVEACKYGSQNLSCGWGKPDANRFGYRCGSLATSTDPAGLLARTCPPPPPCKPQCKNADGSAKECGDDGCGGVCGTCTDPKACDTNFKCSGPPGCNGALWQGVCVGSTLRYCAESQLPNTDGFLMTEDCGQSGGYCGWNEGIAAYSCGTEGSTDPSGTYGAATGCRRCQGKECGDDGCGGSCGSCPSGRVCAANGKCAPPFRETCEGRCGGARVASQSCQCDEGCVDRGDCCGTYEYYCSTRALKASTCGNGFCEDKGGENCASCTADCGACPTQANTAAPWLAPYAQIVAMAGTPAQHAEAVVDPLDRVLPSPSPYPIDGLLAYVPRAGVNAGGPGSVVLSDKIGSTGTTADITGIQGTGIGLATTGATPGPSYGYVRVLPDARLPTRSRFQTGDLGGFSVAFWTRVPSAAPDVPNPLVGMRSAIDTDFSSYTTKRFCAKARPRDGRIDFKCPSVLSTQLNILQVRAYYGSVSSTTAVDADGCPSFEAIGANGNCGSNEIQAIAEASCIGKASCSFNPGRRLTKNTCTEAPFTIAQGLPIVEAFCGISEAPDGAALLVEPTAGGNKIALHVPAFGVPLTSRTAIKDGAWHHVALTYQSYPGEVIGGLATLYVDGHPEGESTNLNLRPISEFLLGAARQGSLSTAASKPSNFRSGSLAAIADFDELFVYDRAIAENEVNSLIQKSNARLLRVWPTLPPARIARASIGITGGAAKSVNVEAPWLLDAGTTTATKPVPYRDPQPALGLPAGVRLNQSSFETEFSGLTNYTFAGWVRVPTLPTAVDKVQTLMSLKLGGAEQLALTTSGCLSGNDQRPGGVGVRVNGQYNWPGGPQACSHNLRAGEWTFVAYTQEGRTRRVMIDGLVAGTFSLDPFTLFGAKTETKARTFEAGDGVELRWAALFERALSPQELETYRSQGPVVWLDGNVYTDTSGAWPRDYANYKQNRDRGGTARPQLWKTSGEATKTASTAPFVLKKDGTGDLGVITIPADGRSFRSAPGPAGHRNRIFSWAGRARLGPMRERSLAIAPVNWTRKSHSVPLIGLDVAGLSGTGTTR